VVPKYAPGF